MVNQSIFILTGDLLFFVLIFKNKHDKYGNSKREKLNTGGVPFNYVVQPHESNILYIYITLRRIV